jgi:hypothetical protein
MGVGRVGGMVSPLLIGDVVADRQKFEIGNRPRHAKAGRVHAPADRE